MQTQPANNGDQKAPAKERIGDDSPEKPTEQDPDQHNPPMKAPSDHEGTAEFHGAATNHEDGATVAAAEGEIAHTPQGP